MMHAFLAIIVLIGLAAIPATGLYIIDIAEKLANKLSSQASSLTPLMKVCAYGIAPIISFTAFAVMLVWYITTVITAIVLIFTAELSAVSMVILALFDLVACIGGWRIAGEHENRRAEQRVRSERAKASERL